MFIKPLPGPTRAQPLDVSWLCCVAATAVGASWEPHSCSAADLSLAQRRSLSLSSRSSHVHQEDSRIDRDPCRWNCWDSPTQKSGIRMSADGLSKIRSCLLLLPLLCPSGMALQAQSRPSAQRESQIGVQEPLRTTEAMRVEQAPKLDGTLDDPVWQQANPVGNFLQREPFEGQPPTEKTEVRIIYTKH